MERTPGQDYSRKGWTTIAALIVVLAVIGFIPPQTFGGLKLRRANILSDLISFEEAAAPPEAAAPLFDEAEFQVDMTEVAERIVADTAARPAVRTTFAWTTTDSIAGRRAVCPDTVRLTGTLVPIEDYSADSAMMQRFCDTLLTAQRPVRIAFLGDSFVEGDILTADLRERLQTAYGGGGTGFAPMASPLTAFRRTVKTQAKGWTAYNIMQHKRTPEGLRGRFFISGWICRPEAGAATRWEATDARRRLDSCSTARVFFISPDDSRIELTLNDSLRQEFTVSGDPSVRQAVVTAPRIGSLAFRVVEGHETFIGYGAEFESPGVVVDNYSVRSNNGQAMFRTDPSVDAQIAALSGGYDLIVLQYGLNLMQQGVHSYGGYGQQIEKMTAFVRECFPGAAVLILGVSDRSVKTEAGFEPMDAVPHMTGHQRRAARNAGAAFWPVSEAMKAAGGMERFVANGWAGKDYTHINYAGGARVAWALADALNDCVRRAYDRRSAARHRQRILDSLHRAAIDRSLLPAPIRPEALTPEEAEAEALFRSIDLDEFEGTDDTAPSAGSAPEAPSKPDGSASGSGIAESRPDRSTPPDADPTGDAPFDPAPTGKPGLQTAGRNGQAIAGTPGSRRSNMPLR